MPSCPRLKLSLSNIGQVEHMLIRPSPPACSFQNKGYVFFHIEVLLNQIQKPQLVTMLKFLKTITNWESEKKAFYYFSIFEDVLMICLCKINQHHMCSMTFGIICQFVARLRKKPPKEVEARIQILPKLGFELIYSAIKENRNIFASTNPTLFTSVFERLSQYERQPIQIHISKSLVKCLSYVSPENQIRNRRKKQCLKLKEKQMINQLLLLTKAKNKILKLNRKNMRKNIGLQTRQNFNFSLKAIGNIFAIHLSHDKNNFQPDSSLKFFQNEDFFSTFSTDHLEKIISLFKVPENQCQWSILSRKNVESSNFHLFEDFIMLSFFKINHYQLNSNLIDKIWRKLSVLLHRSIELLKERMSILTKISFERVWTPLETGFYDSIQSKQIIEGLFCQKKCCQDLKRQLLDLAFEKQVEISRISRKQKQMIDFVCKASITRLRYFGRSSTQKFTESIEQVEYFIQHFMTTINKNDVQTIQEEETNIFQGFPLATQQKKESHIKIEVKDEKGENKLLQTLRQMLALYESSDLFGDPDILHKEYNIKQLQSEGTFSVSLGKILKKCKKIELQKQNLTIQQTKKLKQYIYILFLINEEQNSKHQQDKEEIVKKVQQNNVDKGRNKVLEEEEESEERYSNEEESVYQLKYNGVKQYNDESCFVQDEEDSEDYDEEDCEEQQRQDEEIQFFEEDDCSDGETHQLKVEEYSQKQQSELEECIQQSCPEKMVLQGIYFEVQIEHKFNLNLPARQLLSNMIKYMADL